MTRWVKVPAPGEFRGEGEWKDFMISMKEWGHTLDKANDEWDYLTISGYLPTQESEEKPDDKAMGEKG